MTTIEKINLDGKHGRILAELAALHGQSIQDYCRAVLEFHVNDVLEDQFFAADVGQLVIKGWKEQFEKK